MAEFMRPEEILAAFGIDCQEGGGADFLELIYQLAAYEKWEKQRAPLNKIVDNMRKGRNGISLKGFYGSMRAAILPVLQADDSTLAAFGIYPEKRTSGKMAAAFARLLLPEKNPGK